MTLDLDELERIGKAALPAPWGPHHVATQSPEAMFVRTARNNWQAMIDELREHRGFRQAMRGTDIPG